MRMIVAAMQKLVKRGILCRAAPRVPSRDNVTQGESFCQEIMLPGAVPSFPG
jgi:hypothetical protein